jgi:hypothetical protein
MGSDGPKDKVAETHGRDFAAVLVQKMKQAKRSLRLKGLQTRDDEVVLWIPVITTIDTGATRKEW